MMSATKNNNISSLTGLSSIRTALTIRGCRKNEDLFLRCFW